MAHDRYHRAEPWHTMQGRNDDEINKMFGLVLGTTEDQVAEDLTALLAWLPSDGRRLRRRHKLAALLHRALDHPVSTSALDELVRLSGGNLQVLTEFVRGALDRGVLVRDRGAWQLVGDLPTTVALDELVGEHLAGVNAAGLGALGVAGPDPTPSMDTVAAVMAAKREVALAGVEVCDVAMAVAGGRAYFRGSPIERAYRDIRAAAFHPFTPEQTLLHAGRLHVGLPCDEF